MSMANVYQGPKLTPAQKLAEHIGRLVVQWDGNEIVNKNGYSSILMYDGEVVAKLIQELLDLTIAGIAQERIDTEVALEARRRIVEEMCDE